MPERADVVVIGGGIVGNAISWNLARRRAGRILVLEKETRIGTGATAYSAGGVREQFTSKVNIEMSRLALDILARFPEEMGQDIDYRRAGYLFVASSEEQAGALRAAVAFQNGLGVASRLLTPPEARQRVEALNIEDVVLAAFNERDGYVDPSSICSGYSRCARELGVEVRTRTEVTGVTVRAGKVVAVETPAGRIDTGWVVNAAGPHLNAVGRLAGLDIPAHPYRRMLFITEAISLSPRLIPLTVDMASGFYFRQEGEGIMIGLSDPDEPSSYNTTLDWDFLPRVLEPALHRIPSIESATIGKGWAGLYTITPDHHALLGPFPELPNFLIAGGFSGHGIMHSPAAGIVIAEMIVEGGARSVDVSSLAPTRVREGRLLAERNVI
jgi:sarcosine oxidase subunit beta